MTMKFASADVQFAIDGRPLTLRFSARALAALQDYWQLSNLDEVGQKLSEIESGGLSVQDAAAMFWAGLRTHHKELTVDDALDLLDSIGVANFEALLGAALSGATGGGSNAPENPPKPRRGSRGR